MSDSSIVDYVAKLARIDVSKEQKDFLSSQLSKILEYIDKLKELDVSGVEPMRGFHPNKNVFRSDEPRQFSQREDILDNAPLREDDYFKIPKVLE